MSRDALSRWSIRLQERSHDSICLTARLGPRSMHAAFWQVAWTFLFFSLSKSSKWETSEKAVE
eukprot:scaffold202498_cov17-Tisochrysis_lutea.AAC.1